MLPALLDATLITLRLVAITAILATILGLAIGLILEATNNSQISGNKYKWLYKLLITIVSAANAIPFLLFFTAIMAITRQLEINNEFITIFAMVIIATPMFAHEVFTAINKLPKELSDEAITLGASPMQILWSFLMQEAAPNLIQAFTRLVITLVSLAIAAGIFGKDGLGRLAFELGYQNLQFEYIAYTIIVTAMLILAIQLINNYLVNIIIRK